WYARHGSASRGLAEQASLGTNADNARCVLLAVVQAEETQRSEDGAEQVVVNVRAHEAQGFDGAASIVLDELRQEDDRRQEPHHAAEGEEDFIEADAGDSGNTGFPVPVLERIGDDAGGESADAAGDVDDDAVDRDV